MKYAFMNEWQKRFPLRWMAKILGVSTSGFAAWRKRLDSPREAARNRLLRIIEDIHRASRGSYGSPRIWEQLKGLGFSISKTRVERLMRENGIRAKTKRKFRVTTDSKHNQPVAENRLNRDFSPARVNQFWAADMTYVWTEEGWLYLAVVVDLFSRQIVGWAMNERITQDLTLSALRMAVDRRRPQAGLIHHSDRGSQYAAQAYRKLLEAHGLICSMSRRGNCWDNAVVESFFHTLKTELLYHERLQTRAQARRLIFEWIEVFYNRIRLHSTLGYKSPVQYEELKKAA